MIVVVTGHPQGVGGMGPYIVGQPSEDTCLLLLAHHSAGAVPEEVVAHGETVAALHVLHDQFPLGPGKQDNYHSENGSK